VLRRSVLVALALIVGATGCQARHGPPRVKKLPKRDDTPALRGGGTARSPRIASYKIEARLDGTRHTITASETLIWTNAGTTAVTELPFHLYLNAFKNEQSLFMRTSHGEMRRAKASDTGWGWTSLESVTIGGSELVGKLTYPHQPDETVAIVPLEQPIEPGSTIEVQLKFTAQLPEVFARTGYKGDFHLVGQWFPKIGVRVGPPGAERWECQPHHAFTEFFADFGSYDVALTVPATYVIAATGVLVSATEAPGQTRTFTYHAEDVHDFVWMADPYMVTDATGKTPFVAKAKVEDGEVEVRVYARKEQTEFAKRHLKAAVGAIERFSAYFMPYPWPIMTVIDPPMDAASGAGGMEYPTLVTTAGDSVFARPGLRLPEYTTVHEIGHNWFQGILASNEPEEAWLDEGVNEWADAVVMRDIYGPRANAADWRGWQADIAALRKAVAKDPSLLPIPIATAAYAFVDFDAGAIATYISTARALETLEAQVGAVKFMAAMRAYVRAFAFKHPTGRDLYATLERELGLDLGWFFDPVFQQVGGIKLKVRTAECRRAHAARGVFNESPKPAPTPSASTGSGDVPVAQVGARVLKTITETEAPETGTYVCEVVVENTGVIHIAVDIELEFADGARQRVKWDDRGHASWQRFVIERSSRLVEVNIDPDRKIALANPTEHHVRIDGDGAASLRASARIASWAQFLMQLVGP